MKVILIKPNGKNEQYGNLKELSAIEPPLWLAILANYYKATKILDAEVEDLSFQETIQKTENYQPDRIIILASGSHPSAYIQQRQLCLDLYNNLKGKFDTTFLSQLPCSPIKWGKPRWDLLPINEYRAHNWHCWGGLNRQPYGVVYTSTGCPYNCSFCCIKNFYGNTYEARLEKDVLDDFADLANLNIKNIKIMDELFILNKKRVHDICDGIIDYKFNIWAYARIDIIDEKLLIKLKKANVNWLAYGIESGNDEIRKAIMKGNFDKTKIKDIIQMTHDNGIHIVGNYMFGFWEDSLDTMKETLDFAKELNCEYANFYCVVAYPESKLYQDMKNKGVSLPTNWNDYAQFSESFKPLSTKFLTFKEVLEFRDKTFLEYFSNIKYLASIQKIFGIETVNEIMQMTKINLKRFYD